MKKYVLKNKVTGKYFNYSLNHNDCEKLAQATIFFSNIVTYNNYKFFNYKTELRKLKMQKINENRR